MQYKGMFIDGGKNLAFIDVGTTKLSTILFQIGNCVAFLA